MLLRQDEDSFPRLELLPLVPSRRFALVVVVMAVMVVRLARPHLAADCSTEAAAALGPRPHLPFSIETSNQNVVGYSCLVACLFVSCAIIKCLSLMTVNNKRGPRITPF